MNTKVSVIVPIGVDDGLSELVASIEEQSLSYSDFEVLFAATGSTEGVRARLAHLTERRPNMRVLDGDGAATETDLKAVLGHAQGDYVIFLRAGDHVFPEALARLHDVGTSSEADLVVGRTTGTIGRQLFRNAVHLDGELDLPVDCMAYRRDFLLDQDLGPASSPAGRRNVELQRLATRSAKGIAVLADYPCLSGTYPGEESLTTRDASAAWQVDKLSVRVVAESHLHAGDPEGTWARLILRDHRTGMEYPLETEALPQVGGVGLAAHIDPATAALGQPLPDGSWQVWAQLVGDDFYLEAPVVVKNVPPALLNGRVVAPTRRASALELQVGVTEESLVRAKPADTSIEESASGSLLTIALTGLHVRGTSEIDARLFLGRLALPATVDTADGQGARLRAYVSGLAGTYPISAQIGSPGPLPTGLTLNVSGLGQMTVVKTVPAARKASKPKLGGDASAQPVQSPPLAQRVRRRLPEPVVNGIAKSARARSIYGRLLRR